MYIYIYVCIKKTIGISTVIIRTILAIILILKHTIAYYLILCYISYIYIWYYSMLLMYYGGMYLIKFIIGLYHDCSIFYYTYYDNAQLHQSPAFWKKNKPRITRLKIRYLQIWWFDHHSPTKRKKTWPVRISSIFIHNQLSNQIGYTSHYIPVNYPLYVYYIYVYNKHIIINI